MAVTVQVRDKEIPVLGMDAERVAASPKFLRWIQGEVDSEFEILHVTVQAATFAGENLLFATLSCQVAGGLFPWVVFLRGHSVAVLVVIHTAWGDYTLVVHQRCFPIGDPDFPSLAAGMQNDEGDFVGVVAKELKEETGLEIGAEKLQLMGYYHPSPGGSDEIIRVFSAEFDMTVEQVGDLKGRLTGNLEEGEFITLQVCRLEDLPTVAAHDSKALVAYLWWMMKQQQQ